MTYLAKNLQMPSQRACVVKQLKPLNDSPQIYQIVRDRVIGEIATSDRAQIIGRDYDRGGYL